MGGIVRVIGMLGGGGGGGGRTHKRGQHGDLVIVISHLSEGFAQWTPEALIGALSLGWAGDSFLQRDEGTRVLDTGARAAFMHRLKTHWRLDRRTVYPLQAVYSLRGCLEGIHYARHAHA